MCFIQSFGLMLRYALIRSGYTHNYGYLIFSPLSMEHSPHLKSPVLCTNEQILFEINMLQMFQGFLLYNRTLQHITDI